MPSETDAAIYELFKLAALNAMARCPLPAEVETMSVRARPDGSEYTVYPTLCSKAEFMTIPWDVIGGVRKLTWRPNGHLVHPGPSRRPSDLRKVEISIGYHGGVSIYNDLHESNYPFGPINCRSHSETLGTSDTIRTRTICTLLPDKDAVVARVVEEVQLAYKVARDERRYARDDSYFADDLSLEDRAYREY